MKTIDMKSFLVGCLMAAILFLSVGASSTHNSYQPRYQLLSHDDNANFAFVFDTQTGAIVRIYFKGTATITNNRGEAFISGERIREALNN